MKRILPILLAFSMLVTSCITFSPKTQVAVEPSFVTSTLPPTRSLVTRPSVTPALSGTPSTPTLAVTVPADCKVVAVLIEDVTIPDGSQLGRGKSFTKTWKFKNIGTCPWQGYKLGFVSGDRMGAPETAPVDQTLAGEMVNVSVDLVAPAADGSYTGFFELQDADGNAVPIGLEKTFWVKIVVGAGGIPLATSAGPGVSGTQTSGGGNTGNCQASGNAGHVSELLALINAVREEAGVPALSLNSQLSAAAQGHSEDMACNSLISHTGSDGSSIGGRIAGAGYAASYYIEVIAVGTPQDAMAQWNDDALHRNALIDRNVTDIGIGYAYSASSAYGGHITVDMACP
jgi:uncharacterized protein YkwD